MVSEKQSGGYSHLLRTSAADLLFETRNFFETRNRSETLNPNYENYARAPTAAGSGAETLSSLPLGLD